MNYGSYSGTFYGRIRCTYTYRQRCLKYALEVNSNQSNPSTPDQRSALMCHELGHVPGLAHTSSTVSCMRTGTFSHLDNTLSVHDRDQINDNYPWQY